MRITVEDGLLNAIEAVEKVGYEVAIYPCSPCDGSDCEPYCVILISLDESMRDSILNRLGSRVVTYHEWYGLYRVETTIPTPREVVHKLKELIVV